MAGTMSLVTATCFVVYWMGTHAFIFSTVPCPNMASNCITDTFNTVFENLGCLGCQGGCRDGYMMTNNPKHHRDTNDTNGHYTYQNIPVQNKIDVFEPQWICTPGDKCLPGYFLSQIGPQTSCAYCGEGCSRCTDYTNCQSCFGGYRLNPRTLPSGKHVASCSNSGVLCPNKTSHCVYPMYVSSGAGCLGCLLCEDGYTPTFNPLYYDHTTVGHGTYTYNNITIRNDRNVNEPRFVCVKGANCTAGWYKREVAGSTVCDWCGDGCVECTGKNTCTKCQTGYTLDPSGPTCRKAARSVKHSFSGLVKF